MNKDAQEKDREKWGTLITWGSNRHGDCINANLDQARYGRGLKRLVGDFVKDCLLLFLWAPKTPEEKKS